MREAKIDERTTSAKPEEPEYWLPEEFAALIRKHPKSVYRLTKDPSFPVTRVGGAIRIPRARARRWLDKQTQGRPAR